MAHINLENTSAPSTPAPGKTKLFVDPVDGHVKRIDSTGTITDLEETATGGALQDYDVDTSIRITFTTGVPPTEVAHAFTTKVLPAGTYLIRPSVIWSHDETNSDYLGNVTAGASNGYPINPMHREEPAESGGGGPGGTNQRIPNPYPPFEFVLASDGTIDIEILYGTDDGSDESTVYYSAIEVWSVPA